MWLLLAHARVQESQTVLWCGVVWCGVVWCGAVWCVVLFVCLRDDDSSSSSSSSSNSGGGGSDDGAITPEAQERTSWERGRESMRRSEIRLD